MYNPIFILAIVFLCQRCLCAPYQDVSNSRNTLHPHKTTEIKKFSNREMKKDIFISRGWGAGGMPFSVLYMNPTFASSKAPATVDTNPSRTYNLAKSQRKSLPQVRTSMRQKSFNRTPHSVIPQLFVSYGWGPLGK